MNQLKQEIETAKSSANKLILIVGGPGSGKSKLIHDYSEDTGIPILNLDRIFKDDTSDLLETLTSFLDNYDKEVLLLDNKKVLYSKNSKIDMLQFLKELSQKVIVVATWNGRVDNNKIIHIRSKLATNIEYPLDESITIIQC